MDPTKLFEALTWANLTIVEDELAVQEFEINLHKHKNMRKVCSQLKIKGRRIPQKRQFSRSLFIFTRSRKYMARLQTALISLL